MSPSCEASLETEAGKPITISGILTLGRSYSNSIVLTAGKVSRRHALIHAQNSGELWLVDLGSSNGTYINDRRIDLPVKLRDQDRISIGDHSFTFRQNEDTFDIQRTQSQETIREFRIQTAWLLVADIENFALLSQRLATDRLAILVGTWMLKSKMQVANHGGTINKYLGDGFLAYWLDTEGCTPKIASLVKEMLAICSQEPRFRIVLHLGDISVTGSPLLGEELIGSQVNFIFRTERLASLLRVPILISEPANAKLSKLISTRLLDNHKLKGFDDLFSFFVPEILQE